MQGLSPSKLAGLVPRRGRPLGPDWLPLQGGGTQGQWAEEYLRLEESEGAEGNMSGGTSTCSGPGEASDLKFPVGTRLREPLTEARFQQIFGVAAQEPELPAESRVPRLCRLWRRRVRACSGAGAWRLLLARLPPLRWLPHYRWRAWLLGDAVAGVTVGVVHVPQGESQSGRAQASEGFVEEAWAGVSWSL